MADKLRTLGPGSFTVGAAGAGQRNLAIDVTNIVLTPSTDSEDPDNYLDGHQEGGGGTTSWPVGGNVGEDYTMDGWQAWCALHAGEALPFEFIPNLAGKVKWTGNLTVQPIEVGGDVKSKNKKDFTFPATDVTPEKYGATSPEG